MATAIIIDPAKNRAGHASQQLAIGVSRSGKRVLAHKEWALAVVPANKKEARLALCSRIAGRPHKTYESRFGLSPHDVSGSRDLHASRCIVDGAATKEGCQMRPRVVVIDDLSTGHRDFVRFGPLVGGDIRNTAAITEAVQSFGAVAVIHFAVCAYVGESVAELQKYHENNVLGTPSLLRGLFDAGYKKIVFSNTCAVYGQSERVSIDKATPSTSAPAGATRSGRFSTPSRPEGACRLSMVRAAPGDPAVLVADPSRARAVLGFKPRLSDPWTIVRTAWAWHCQAHPRKRATIQ